MSFEPRRLEFRFEMPLEFDEDAFLQRARRAVEREIRGYGGHPKDSTFSHGAISRAEHFAALAAHARQQAHRTNADSEDRSVRGRTLG